MNRNHWAARLIALLLLSGAALTVALSAAPGGEEDPLVTLSYLNETFLPQLLARVDERLAGYPSQTQNAASDSFIVVTLSGGQTLYGDVGCEVMLRVGSASCVSPTNPGLIDSTTGGTLNNGAALEQNHLYLLTMEERGVRAASDTTKLLIHGGYRIS